MMWKSACQFVGTFLLCISVSSTAVGAVYKCVDSFGNTGYQAKPCDDSHKSNQIEIEEFVKPADVTTNESASETRSIGADAQGRSEKRKKEMVAACRKLKKEYGRDLRRAKADDAARSKAIRDDCKSRRGSNCRGSGSDILAQKERERSFKSIKNWKKNKKRRKKSRSRSNYRSVTDTHNVDRVKSRYKNEKKRLKCDSI